MAGHLQCWDAHTVHLVVDVVGDLGQRGLEGSLGDQGDLVAVERSHLQAVQVDMIVAKKKLFEQVVVDQAAARCCEPEIFGDQKWMPVATPCAST